MGPQNAVAGFRSLRAGNVEQLRSNGRVRRTSKEFRKLKFVGWLFPWSVRYFERCSLVCRRSPTQEATRSYSVSRRCAGRPKTAILQLCCRIVQQVSKYLGTWRCPIVWFGRWLAQLPLCWAREDRAQLIVKKRNSETMRPLRHSLKKFTENLKPLQCAGP